MKKLSILVLIFSLLSQPVLARKSGGLEFWQGLGGKIVGVVALWGGYYWLIYDTKDEHTADKDIVQQKSKLSLYFEDDQFQVDSNLGFSSKQEIFPILNVKYSFNELIRIEPSRNIESYGFVSFNNRVINFKNHLVNFKNNQFAGIGLSYQTGNQGLIKLEVSTPIKFNQYDQTNISLKYQFDF